MYETTMCVVGFVHHKEVECNSSVSKSALRESILIFTVICYPSVSYLKRFVRRALADVVILLLKFSRSVFYDHNLSVILKNLISSMVIGLKNYYFFTNSLAKLLLNSSIS